MRGFGQRMGTTPEFDLRRAIRSQLKVSWSRKILLDEVRQYQQEQCDHGSVRPRVGNTVTCVGCGASFTDAEWEAL